MDTQKRAAMLCLSGLDTAEFIERAAPHVPHDRPLVLLYVIDMRPAEDLGYIARRLQARPGMSHMGAEKMSAADEETARVVLEEAEARCRQLGYAGQITVQIRRGRPEQEIVAQAEEASLGIGLVVIGASYKRGPHPRTGPASVGHVARFVVDHSPCDVLLLRS
jgi:nucleotide-binding universal stress UspA family protein